MRVILLVFILVVSSPALSQQSTGTNNTQSDELSADIQALIKILEDDQARARLIEKLRSTDPQDSEPSVIVASEQAIAHQLANYARSAASSTGDLVQAVIGFGRHTVALVTGRATMDTHRIWTAVREVALVVLVTFATFFLLQAIFLRIQKALAGKAKRHPEVGHRIGIIVLSAAADLLTVLLAWAAGYVPAFLMGWGGQMGTERAHFLSAFLFIELAKVAARVLLAPKWPSLRFSHIEDMQAAYWYFWLSRLISIIGYTFFFLAPILAIGVSQGAAEALRVFVLFCALAMSWIIILQNRDAVRSTLVHYAEKSTSKAYMGFIKNLARLWHVAAIAYVTLVFVLWLVNHETALPFVLGATAKSILAIALGVLAARAMRRLATRGTKLPRDLKERVPLLEKRLKAFVPNVMRVFRIIIAIVVMLVVAQFWNLANLAGWLSTELGQRVAGALLSAFIIMLVGALIYLAVHSWVEYRLSPHIGKVPTARERTLFSLFRNAFTIVLAVIVGMLVLSELGVHIGPLLAGAGVVGVAFGFGGQLLVRDVINGAFIQFENALNEGDVASMAGVRGTVEKLTIRSVSLRTLDGAYHLIPFSAVDAVANYTRNFSYCLFNIRVDIEEDASEVKNAMQEAFKRLSKSEMGEKILGELEMHGVTAFGDSATMVRARLKTAPGEQFALKSAYHEILMQVFRERGIKQRIGH